MTSLSGKIELDAKAEDSNAGKIFTAGIDCGKEDKSFERILLGSNGRIPHDENQILKILGNAEI